MTEKTHTITIDGLDDYEAEHISHLLHGYEVKMLADITHHMARQEDLHVDWSEKHLAWHKETMMKIKWKSEDVDHG
jgi:hypothetical protein